MRLTLEETKKRLQDMAEENIRKREAFGVEGDNPEYVTLVNARNYLS